jgi:hypothetical protein
MSGLSYRVTSIREGAHSYGPEAVAVLDNENPLCRGVEGCDAGGRGTNRAGSTATRPVHGTPPETKE